MARRSPRWNRRPHERTAMVSCRGTAGSLTDERRGSRPMARERGQLSCSVLVREPSTCSIGRGIVAVDIVCA